MSGISGPKIITSGCVLSLDAADKNSYPGSGTAWRDLSGNGKNLTLTNGPTFSAGNQGSIVFDGTNDYAVLNPVSAFNIYCISMWFKPTTIINSTSKYNIYINNTLKSTTIGSSLGDVPLITDPDFIYLNSYEGVSGYLDSSLSICTIYNRTLTASELLQNYNAVKNRFGL